MKTWKVWLDCGDASNYRVVTERCKEINLRKRVSARYRFCRVVRYEEQRDG